MKTYYIVRHVELDRSVHYYAHYSGFLSMFGKFNYVNNVPCTYSSSADDCENLLRNVLDPVKPTIVRVVRI